jgi:hypothetical protein
VVYFEIMLLMGIRNFKTALHAPKSPHYNQVPTSAGHNAAPKHVPHLFHPGRARVRSQDLKPTQQTTPATPCHGNTQNSQPHRHETDRYMREGRSLVERIDRRLWLDRESEGQMKRISNILTELWFYPR